MRILLLSNQGMVEPFVGNPIMLRYRDALLNDERINEVKMLRCKRPFRIVKELRASAKQSDLIHVHFGGLYALVTWILLLGIDKPQFITFHGTDIHAKAINTSKSLIEKMRIKLNQYASFLSILCYDRCGFVATEMENYVPQLFKKILAKKKFHQSLGVNYELFYPIPKEDAQKRINLIPGKYILFSDVHNTIIKRRDIARAIVDNLPGYKLLIMCGVKPKDVPMYINASECVLLTSDQEGSPNIIREALSLNKPVFSVNVGDAAVQLKGLVNSCIISRDVDTASEKIKEMLNIQYVDNTREQQRSKLDFSECVKDVISNIYL